MWSFSFIYIYIYIYIISNNTDCSMDISDLSNHIKHYVCLLCLQQALIRTPTILPTIGIRVWWIMVFDLCQKTKWFKYVFGHNIVNRRSRIICWLKQCKKLASNMPIHVYTHRKEGYPRVLTWLACTHVFSTLDLYGPIQDQLTRPI